MPVLIAGRSGPGTAPALRFTFNEYDMAYKTDSAQTKAPLAREGAAAHSGDSHMTSTLARGFELLQCFTAEKPILGNKELSRLTGMPKATVSRLTYTLCKLGYLRPDYVHGKYQLGGAVVSLVHPVLAKLQLRQAARPAMKELADRARGAVSIGMRDRLRIVYVETSRSTSIFSRYLTDIGMNHPLIGCGMGRAYIAGASPEEREAIINEARLKTPDLWDKHAGQVEDSIASVEDCGFCISYGDARYRVNAVAVPFRLSTGELLAFNCVVQSVVADKNRLEKDLGPRLYAVVRGLEGL